MDSPCGGTPDGPSGWGPVRVTNLTIQTGVYQGSGSGRFSYSTVTYNLVGRENVRDLVGSLGLHNKAVGHRLVYAHRPRCYTEPSTRYYTGLTGDFLVLGAYLQICSLVSFYGLVATYRFCLSSL